MEINAWKKGFVDVLGLRLEIKILGLTVLLTLIEVFAKRG
jgi:hypothetical protein